MDNAAYLRLAYAEAARSPDPSTQNGAVLVSGAGHILGRGHNRFALGLTTTDALLADRAQKYPRTAHAETNAIWDALRGGASMPDLAAATLYVAWYACDRCAADILEAGIPRVVGHRQHPGVLHLHSKWSELVAVGLAMLREGGVVCEYHDDGGAGLGCAPVRLDYKYWTP